MDYLRRPNSSLLSNLQPSFGGLLSGLSPVAATLPRPVVSAPVFNGLQVDMFALGNADSILVTSWSNSHPVRVLIDGGCAEHGDVVLAKLAALGITRLDHVVCSHSHQDHAGGLIKILNSRTIITGKVWTHLPWKHIDFARLTASLSSAKQKKIAKVISESLETQQQIARIIDARRIPFAEPFQGARIGPLFVCGPSLQFYETLLSDFADLEKLNEFELNFQQHDIAIRIEEIFDAAGGDGGGELGAEPTEPENEASVILYAQSGTQKLLFTADAGVGALTAATTAYDLRNLAWMQIPHHGSRRNLTQKLVEYFRPGNAFVSADGTRKHPRRKVVNAFKAVGTKVYSTHHPGRLDLHQWFGQVPKRAGYDSATPL